MEPLRVNHATRHFSVFQTSQVRFCTGTTVSLIVVDFSQSLLENFEAVPKTLLPFSVCYSQLPIQYYQGC